QFLYRKGLPEEFASSQISSYVTLTFACLANHLQVALDRLPSGPRGDRPAQLRVRDERVFRLLPALDFAVELVTAVVDLRARNSDVNQRASRQLMGLNRRAAKLFMLSARSARLADAPCANLCFARRHARFAKFAVHPAVCLTTANRSADDVR